LTHKGYSWQSTSWDDPEGVENAEKKELLARTLLQKDKAFLGPIYRHYQELQFVSPLLECPEEAKGRQVLYIQLDKDGVNIGVCLRSA
jgi:hypothetical protein